MESPLEVKGKIPEGLKRAPTAGCEAFFIPVMMNSATLEEAMMDLGVESVQFAGVFPGFSSTNDSMSARVDSNQGGAYSLPLCSHPPNRLTLLLSGL